MTTARIELPPKLIPVFQGKARYRGAYGGRGSGKTRAFALMTAIWAYRWAEAGSSGVILCGREFMNSLDESSMEEIKVAIRSVDWLNDYFDIGEKYIRTKNGRVKYVFAGLRHNIDSLKSKARILVAWIDEAESVSEMAWRKLIPTVREEGSEIWCTWNPESEESATHQRFRVQPHDKIVEINWQDNPWFPDALNQERLLDAEYRADTYGHTWEGQFLTLTDAQVFGGKYAVKDFEPASDWSGPYPGMDFGFAKDPTAAVECWIYGDELYIRRECGKVGLELDHTSEYVTSRIPSFKDHASFADSARPETISYLNRHGMPRLKGVKKWQGSVEDGVEFIKSFRKVNIHTDCTAVAREFRLYAYKVDSLSGLIKPSIVDANNHYIDAIRYALSPMIKPKGATGLLIKSKYK